MFDFNPISRNCYNSWNFLCISTKGISFVIMFGLLLSIPEITSKHRGKGALVTPYKPLSTTPEFMLTRRLLEIP